MDRKIEIRNYPLQSVNQFRSGVIDLKHYLWDENKNMVSSKYVSMICIYPFLMIIIIREHPKYYFYGYQTEPHSGP